MKTTLDCMACFIRQSLEAARRVSDEPAVHERIVRDVMRWASEMDLALSPPVMAQRIHRRLREMTGVKDPYRQAKDQCNRIGLKLLPELEDHIATAADPLLTAVRLAAAGNAIDMGVQSCVTLSEIRSAITQALRKPIEGPMAGFRRAAAEADRILYLADNAGEIVFDRLLIEALGSRRITLSVRGSPVLNDATIEDAKTAGLYDLVDVIENGSDAPGTILEECNDEFRKCYQKADLIIAKGQGNFETLSRETRNIYFLFKVKCAVIASHVHEKIGTHVLFKAGAAI